ncbi:MAG: lytic transglycosylase domain-containing protein [Terriglobales bacterium]
MKIWTTFASLLWTFIVFVCVSAHATDLAVLQNGFTIPHDHRQIIGSITRLYIDRGNTSYVDVPTIQIVNFEKDLTPPAPPPAPKVEHSSTAAAPPSVALTKPVAKAPDLNEVINSASDHTQIDPDLINSVIHAESGYNPHALSPKGAQGLMQLMPKTAANLGVANSFDPAANVDGGTRYLRELLELYHFDLVKALAAYNAGPLRVKQYHGVPPYNETRAYVARIIRDFNNKKLAEQKAAALAAKKKNKQQSIQKSQPVTQITVESPRAGESR